MRAHRQLREVCDQRAVTFRSEPDRGMCGCRGGRAQGAAQAPALDRSAIAVSSATITAVLESNLN
jgi:hypothetical protein